MGSAFFHRLQNFYFPRGAVQLDEPEKAGEQAKLLLDFFRKNNALIVHVKHEFSPGSEIHELVKPLNTEKIITKNEVITLEDFLNTQK